MKTNKLTDAVRMAAQDSGRATREPVTFYYRCRVCDAQGSSVGHSTDWEGCMQCGAPAVDLHAGSVAPEWWLGDPVQDAPRPLKCKSIFGHRYRPRYDTKPPAQSLNEFDGMAVSVRGMVKIINSMRQQIYVADVCTRCGDVIRRQVKEDGQH